MVVMAGRRQKIQRPPQIKKEGNIKLVCLFGCVNGAWFSLLPSCRLWAVGRQYDVGFALKLNKETPRPLSLSRFTMALQIFASSNSLHTLWT